MSYILEALRRAEAERQRGAVPGLHAQPAATALADAGLMAAPAGASGRWRLAALAGAGLVALGAVAVGWLKPAQPDRAAAPTLAVVATAPPTVAPTPTPPTALANVVATPAPTAQPSLMPAPAAAPLPRLPAAPASTAPIAPPIPPAAAAVVAAASVPAPRLASPTPPARLPTLAELPDALRRELPALSLGGAVYAEQSAQRMVIVNGQVFHEGDRLGADLQVQEIRLKSVVFSQRGQRFEMPL